MREMLHEIDTKEYPAKDALLRLEEQYIPPLADRPILNPESIMEARIENIAFATGSIGTFVPNEAVIQAVIESNTVMNEEPIRIRGLKFQGGFRQRHEVDTRSRDYQERYTAPTIAAMAKKVADTRQWDGIDLLVIGSSSIIEDMPEMITDQLREILPIDQVMHNHMACSSAGEGIIDGALLGGNTKLRVVVVGTDELSSLTDFDPVTFANFSDGIAAIAFESREIEVLSGRTVIERDTDNILTVNPFAPLPNRHISDESRRFSRFSLKGEATADYFRYSDRGTYLAIPSNGRDEMEMRAKKTWEKFVMGGAPQLAAEIITPYEHLITAFNGHQPGFEVVSGFNTMLTRKRLQMRGLSPIEAKVVVVSLADKSEDEQRNILGKYNLPYLTLPWDIGKTKFSNVSAAVSLIQLCYAAAGGRMKPGDIIAEQFMGVGSTYGTYVLQLH